MPPPDPQNPIPPQVAVVAQMLAQGVLDHFVRNFPTGIANPKAPLVVKRETKNGPIMEQTCFAQLTAEMIDEMKKLRSSINKLSDLTAEALEETTTRRGR